MSRRESWCSMLVPWRILSGLVSVMKHCPFSQTKRLWRKTLCSHADGDEQGCLSSCRDGERRNWVGLLQENLAKMTRQLDQSLIEYLREGLHYSAAVRNNPGNNSERRSAVTQVTSHRRGRVRWK